MGSTGGQDEPVPWDDEHQAALRDRLAFYKQVMLTLLAQKFPNALGDSLIPIAGSLIGGDTALVFYLGSVSLNHAQALRAAVNQRWHNSAQVMETEYLTGDNDAYLESKPTLAVHLYVGAAEPPIRRGWVGWSKLAFHSARLFFILMLLYWTVVSMRGNTPSTPAGIPNPGTKAFDVNYNRFQYPAVGGAPSGPQQLGPDATQPQPIVIHKPRPART